MLAFQVLLEDEDQGVRRVAVTGVCQVICAYQDQIPQEVTADLLNILFTKLAWDQSSIDVRVAVIQVENLYVSERRTREMSLLFLLHPY